MKEYFRLKEAVEYSSLPERLLRESLRRLDRPLPHFRLNQKTILVKRSDLDEWLLGFRRNPANDKQDLERLADQVVEGLI